MSYIDSMNFSHREKIKYMIRDLRVFFAEHYTNGNIGKAKSILEAHNTQVRRSDGFIMTCFGSASIVLFCFGVFFLFIPPSDGNLNKDIDYITPTLSIFRVAFVLIYILFAVGLAIQVFHAYGVNYMYIFELDPHYKMTHWQLYKVGIILFFVLSLCQCMHIMQIKIDTLFDPTPPWFMLVLVIILLIYCFQPFLSCGYRTARYQVLVTVFEIIIAPFGRVRFRDFFLADVITSMGGTLSDIGYSVYFFTSHDFWDDKYPSGKHRFLSVYLIIIGYLPFWFRFC